MRSRFDGGGLRQFERSVPPPSEEGGRVTINDAYDWNSDGTGSTRPNLGEGYEEVLPPTSVKLTISANSDIRFKGGHTEYTLEIGKVLKPTDFDESTTGGRTVGGVVLPNEDGSIKSIIPLNDFCPLEETEIVPYFAPEKGDLALYASGSRRPYFDENGNDLSKNIDYKLSAETMLSGGFVLRKITAPRELNNGTNFRAVTPQPRVSGRVYVYHYDVKTTETGEKLVVPAAAQVTGTIPNGRTIEGWYIVGNGNRIVDENTVVWDRELTIAPYFSRMNGTQNLVGITNPADSNGKPLVFGNEQGNCKPQRVVNGDVTSNAAFYGAASRFENTVAVGGGNGFAELGSEFGYNGTLVKGAEFRYATKVTDGAAVVSIKKAHTFYYNFENFGTSAVDFDIKGVNSGGDCEGPRTRVCLAPGESIRVSYTVTYNLGGANKNIMV